MKIREDLGLKLSGNIYSELRETAENVFDSVGSLRKFVKFNKVDGKSTLGRRYAIKDSQNSDGLYAYNVKPLVEARFDFEIDKEELDMINQGLEPYNLDSFEDAIYRLIGFEEKLFFDGIDELNMQGLYEVLDTDVITVDGSPDSIISAVQKAAVILRKNYVTGPYQIVMGTDLLEYTSKLVGNRTLSAIIQKTLHSNIIVSENIKGALILPAFSPELRGNIGGDLELNVDYIGEDKIKMSIREALNFDILDDMVGVRIKLA